MDEHSEKGKPKLEGWGAVLLGVVVEREVTRVWGA